MNKINCLKNIKLFLEHNSQKIIIIITCIVSTALAITLFVEHFQACKNQMVSVTYSNQYSNCRCKTFMTDTTLLNYVQTNGYAGSILKTNPIIGLGISPTNIVSFVLKNKIIESENWKIANLQTFVPITNWNTQFQTMDIQPFSLQPSYSFIYFSYMNSEVSTAYTNSPCTDTNSYGFYNLQYQFNNQCIYMNMYIGNNTLINNTVVPPQLLNMAASMNNAVINDFNNNLFSTKNVTYCIPDYCLIPSCNQEIYSLILLSVSVCIIVLTNQ